MHTGWNSRKGEGTLDFPKSQEGGSVVFEQ